MEKELQELKDALYEAWEEIKKLVNNVIEVVSDVLIKRKEEKLKYNWYVPRNTTKQHQVLFRKPMNTNARANL